MTAEQFAKTEIQPHIVTIYRLSNIGQDNEEAHFMTFPVGWGHVQVTPYTWGKNERALYYPAGSVLPDGSVVKVGPKHTGVIRKIEA